MQMDQSLMGRLVRTINTAAGYITSSGSGHDKLPSLCGTSNQRVRGGRHIYAAVIDRCGAASVMMLQERK